jgi:hypothetical protein
MNFAPFVNHHTKINIYARVYSDMGHYVYSFYNENGSEVEYKNSLYDILRNKIQLYKNNVIFGYDKVPYQCLKKHVPKTIQSTFKSNGYDITLYIKYELPYENDPVYGHRC